MPSTTQWVYYDETNRAAAVVAAAACLRQHLYLCTSVCESSVSRGLSSYLE